MSFENKMLEAIKRMGVETEGYDEGCTVTTYCDVLGKLPAYVVAQNTHQVLVTEETAPVLNAQIEKYNLSVQQEASKTM